MVVIVLYLGIDFDNGPWLGIGRNWASYTVIKWFAHAEGFLLERGTVDVVCTEDILVIILPRGCDKFKLILHAFTVYIFNLVTSLFAMCYNSQLFLTSLFLQGVHWVELWMMILAMRKLWRFQMIGAQELRCGLWHVSFNWHGIFYFFCLSFLLGGQGWFIVSRLQYSVFITDVGKHSL